MPYKPGQFIRVGGVDLFDEYGLALLDGWSVPPPAPKLYEVDIPGGDGSIDVTESIAGDVSYQQRQCTFELLYVGGGDFEAVKTRLASMLHGRRLDFWLSADPEYTYTGRFSIDNWYPVVHAGRIMLNCSADPYKLKEHKAVRVAAAGGATVVLPCGRKRQSPRVSCESETLVCFEGQTVRVQPGSWQLHDLWLSEGDNELYVNSWPGGGDMRLGDYYPDSLSSLGEKRLADLAWSERPPDTEDRAVYIDYDIKDL